jgi:chromosome segregation ATPase
VPLPVDNLKTERDKLKQTLRELEIDQRRLEAELKHLRQREIQTKREIEALTTLIEIHDTPPREGSEPAETSE